MDIRKVGNQFWIFISPTTTRGHMVEQIHKTTNFIRELIFFVCTPLWFYLVFKFFSCLFCFCVSQYLCSHSLQRQCVLVFMGELGGTNAQNWQYICFYFLFSVICICSHIYLFVFLFSVICICSHAYFCISPYLHSQSLQRQYFLVLMIGRGGRRKRSNLSPDFSQSSLSAALCAVFIVRSS